MTNIPGLKATNFTSSIVLVFSSKRKSCNFGSALAAHFLTYTDGSLAHFPTATRTRGAITWRRIPAIVRSAHARTNGLGSPKSFWKQFIESNASFGRLKHKLEQTCKFFQVILISLRLVIRLFVNKYNKQIHAYIKQSKALTRNTIEVSMCTNQLYIVLVYHIIFVNIHLHKPAAHNLSRTIIEFSNLVEDLELADRL